MHTDPGSSLFFPRRSFFGLSPWLVLGMAAILGLTITVLSVRNTQRERGYMTQNMMDRAEALIWALEAGTRTWMGMRSASANLLQPLVEETAKQPGIIFLAVTDGAGTILAHSDPARIGGRVEESQLPRAEEVRATPSWRLQEREGKALFEVYRSFTPFKGDHHMHSRWWRDFCGRHSGGRRGMASARPELSTGIVFVGLDRKAFEDALAEDFRNSLVSAVLVAAMGFAGFISLFWAHSYRRSRRMLKDSQAMASEVVTNLPLGLLTCDVVGAVAMINDTALAMFHIVRQDADKIPLERIAGLEWNVILTELAAKRKILEREVVLSPPGRKPAAVSLSAATMRNDDGVFLGNLFILRDITEIKRLQAEAQRNDRLAALGNLAAGVAHEIRNPLSTIKGVATYIAKRMQPGGREQEAANTMIVEVDRLNRVVSELLEFARPDAITVVETTLREVIDRALRLAEADIRAKKIQVVVEEEPDFPSVFINPERFTQALLNLFLNAVQAMEDKGTLRIAVQSQPEQDCFSVTVSDTGPGISERARALLFTPYFTTKSSGTGLGLAIVHRIIEGHGGSIRVENIPGSGAECTIILPLRNRTEEGR